MTDDGTLLSDNFRLHLKHLKVEKRSYYLISKKRKSFMIQLNKNCKEKRSTLI